MTFTQIQLNRDITGSLRAGILEISNLACRRHHQDLWRRIEMLQQEYRKIHATPPDALARLKPARDLYRAVGIEPTRIRPSSEALLRRVIKGKPLYQINSIVDACNYASLTFLLPIGLYDRDKLQGSVEFRLGRTGESYHGIGKDSVHVAGRLTLADSNGPFGNPSSDSLRTAIDLRSRDILLVIFAPYLYPPEKLDTHLTFTAHTLLEFHPGAKLDTTRIME